MLNKHNFEVLTLFDQAKAKYFQVLELNDNDIINNKEAVSGIYALFFVSDKIENIIPLYIGQSKNIKNRFRAHKTALNKLFKMTDEQLDEHLRSGKQDGNHLYTKMILFLKAHNLTLKDLKIKVLASNITKTYFRLQKEQEFITYYQTETFGFNQLEFIQLANRHSNMSNATYSLSSISKMWNCGIQYLDQFNLDLLNYGFYQFNFESFLSWAWLEIERVENRGNDNHISYPQKMINPIIFQEFKDKFTHLINQLNITTEKL